VRFKFYFKQPDLVRIDTDRGQVTVEPDGEIRGRRGKGLLGKISRRLSREDLRLKDHEGIPFCDGHYAATVARIRSQVKAGATARVSAAPDGLNLEVRSGEKIWRYRIDPETLFFRECAVSERGDPIATTRYSDFRPNVGLETGRFCFWAERRSQGVVGGVRWFAAALFGRRRVHRRSRAGACSRTPCRLAPDRLLRAARIGGTVARPASAEARRRRTCCPSGPGSPSSCIR